MSPKKYSGKIIILIKIKTAAESAIIKTKYIMAIGAHVYNMKLLRQETLKVLIFHNKSTYTISIVHLTVI